MAYEKQNIQAGISTIGINKPFDAFLEGDGGESV